MIVAFCSVDDRLCTGGAISHLSQSLDNKISAGRKTIDRSNAVVGFRARRYLIRKCQQERRRRFGARSKLQSQTETT